MKTRLISCIFCKCQILASPDLVKYEDHLQGWHNVTVAEELERALQLAGGGNQGTAGSDLPTSSPSCPLAPPGDLNLYGSFNLLDTLHMSPAFSVNSFENVKAEPVEDSSYHQEEAGTKKVISLSSLRENPDDEILKRSLFETNKCLVQLEQTELEVGSVDIEEAGPGKSERGEPALDVGHTEAKTHAAKHQGKDKVKCDECGKYVSKRFLMIHKSSLHKGQKPIECKVNGCEERFSTPMRLADHKRATHDFAKLKCNVEGCGAEFLVLQELKNHKRNNHKIACKVESCEKRFRDEFYLMDHMRAVHNYSKLKCNFEDCSAEFASDSGLSSHKKKHMKRSDL